MIAFIVLVFCPSFQNLNVLPFVCRRHKDSSYIPKPELLRETDRQTVPPMHVLVRFIFLCDICSIYLGKWVLDKPSLGFC